VQTVRESITRFLICVKVAKRFKFNDVLVSRQGGQEKGIKKPAGKKTSGLHNLGISKKSSGTYSDCGREKKFWTSVKKFYKGSNGQIITINVPASVSKTFAIA